MGDMGSEIKPAPHNPVLLRLHSVDEMGPFNKITYVLNPSYLVSGSKPEEGLVQLGLCSAGQAGVRESRVLPFYLLPSEV